MIATVPAMGPYRPTACQGRHPMWWPSHKRKM